MGERVRAHAGQEIARKIEEFTTFGHLGALLGYALSKVFTSGNNSNDDDD